MASVYKRGQDRRRKDRPYYIAYNDENGRRRVVCACTDYTASEEIARKLESEVALRRRGVIDPAQERFADQARRPIREHVREFLETVRASDRAPRYMQQVKARIEAFIAFAEPSSLLQFDADRVTAFVLALRGRRLSGVTVNEYLGTLKAFTKWLVATGRLPRDPLASVKKTEAAKIEKTRPRRALSVEQIGELLDAAERRPPLELLTIRHGPDIGKRLANVRPAVLAKAEALGRERMIAYLLALWTGLRRSELKALVWGDVRLDTLPACIALRARTTKAKRGDTIALHPQIADALRRFRPADAKPSDAVLRAVPSMKVLRADLKLAGIEFENEAGRVDLHAMRKTVATMLATHGVPQRIAQAHLRHKDPRLTAGTYTDEALLPTAATIAGLPWLPTTPVPEREALRATGTVDRRVGERAAHLQRARHANVHLGATGCHNDDTDYPESDPAQVVGKTRTCASVQRNSTQRVMRFEPTTFTLAT